MDGERKRTKVLVSSDGELVDGGGNLETLVQNTALSLDADVTGPLDESSEIALVGDGLADSEALGASDEEGGGDNRGLLGLLVGRGGLGSVTLGRSLGGGGSSLGSLCVCVCAEKEKEKKEKKEDDEEEERGRRKGKVMVKKEREKGR